MIMKYFQEEKKSVKTLHPWGLPARQERLLQTLQRGPIAHTANTVCCPAAVVTFSRHEVHFGGEREDVGISFS